MPKKGVFGPKEMPMDAVRASMPDQPKRPKEVNIREAKTGGYVIKTAPGSKGHEFSDDEHVKETLAGAMELAEKHLSGEKPEKKEEQD